MAKIIEKFRYDNGDVRSVRLKVGQSKSNEVCTILEGVVTKIVLFLQQYEARFPDEEHQWIEIIAR